CTRTASAASSTTSAAAPSRRSPDRGVGALSATACRRGGAVARQPGAEQALQQRGGLGGLGPEEAGVGLLDRGDRPPGQPLPLGGQAQPPGPAVHGGGRG